MPTLRPCNYAAWLDRATIAVQPRRQLSAAMHKNKGAGDSLSKAADGLYETEVVEAQEAE